MDGMKDSWSVTAWHPMGMVARMNTVTCATCNAEATENQARNQDWKLKKDGFIATLCSRCITLIAQARNEGTAPA